jgi:outer membrane protein assembly factor BamB
MAWQSKEITSDVCVPLVYQGNLFILNGDGRNKTLSAVDPANGKPKWSVPIESRAVFRASPTGADDKVYCMNEAGEAFVFSAKEPKLLSKAQLGGAGHSRATIVPAGGMVYVRSADKLQAFGK